MRAEVELYARGHSPLHNWDARWKTASLAVFALVLVALERLPMAGLGAVAGLGLLLAGRLPMGVLLARLGAAQVLLLPCLVVLPLTFSGSPLALGPVRVSGEGLRLAGMLYLRAVAVLAVAMAVVYSTPMVTLLRALQSLRVPRVLVEISLLTYRYLFSLWWELTRMRWALATRGFGERPSRASYRPLAGVVGVSLVRSVERTERIQQAMRCRGFTGQLRTAHRFVAGPGDWFKAAACIGLAAALLWLDRRSWGE